MESNLATSADMQRHNSAAEPDTKELRIKDNFSISQIAFGVFFGNVITAIVVGILYTITKAAN